MEELEEGGNSEEFSADPLTGPICVVPPSGGGTVPTVPPLLLLLRSSSSGAGAVGIPGVQIRQQPRLHCE